MSKGYLAIGNGELDNQPEAKKGQKIKCPICKKQHILQTGKSKNDDGAWEESDLLLFYKCGEDAYLFGMNGKEISFKGKKR